MLVTSIGVLVEGVYLATAGYNWGTFAVVLTIMIALVIGWMLTYCKRGKLNVVSLNCAHFFGSVKTRWSSTLGQLDRQRLAVVKHLRRVRRPLCMSNWRT